MSSTEGRPHPAPVDTGERTALLDVIRGFALGGVFLSNVYVWMSGMIFLPREQFEQSATNLTQKIIGGVFGILISGKFMTMFTFLFGLGLSVQFARAAERNDSAVRRYVRRSLGLVCLGVLHLSLLWYGDIVHVYALMGLFVLFFRNRSTKTLIIWGLLLTLTVVPIGMWLELSLPKVLATTDAAKTALAEQTAKSDSFQRQALEVFRGQSYGSVIRMNWAAYRHFYTGPIFMAYNIATLGNFLLGLAAGRLKWFQDVPAHRTAFKRMLGWGIVAGIVSVIVAVLIRHFSPSKTPMQDGPVLSFIMSVLQNVRTLAFALVYMSAIALLFQRPRFQKFFSIYAPVGRMALSNYLAQSAIGMFVFLGLGLGHIGDIRPRWTVIMPCVVFAVQMVLSALWLRYFRFGPVEWLTRSITYGEWQKMRNR